MCDTSQAVPMKGSKLNKKKLKCICNIPGDCIPMIRSPMPLCICDMPNDYEDFKPMDQPWLGKRFVLCKSLYFDKYLEALGVGPILRKMGNSLYPMVKVSYSAKNNKCSLLTTTDYLASFIRFTIGKEFNETTVDGRICKSLVTLNENKLIHVQNHPNVTTTIIREFCSDGMFATFKVKDVTALRSYKIYVEPQEEPEKTDESELGMGEGFGDENAFAPDE